MRLYDVWVTYLPLLKDGIDQVLLLNEVSENYKFNKIEEVGFEKKVYTVDELLQKIKVMGICIYGDSDNVYKYLIDIESEIDHYPHYPLFRNIKNCITPLIRNEKINKLLK